MTPFFWNGALRNFPQNCHPEQSEGSFLFIKILH